MSKKIPITVISGYLGAGKTTLILHLLKCKMNKRIGIVVNDLASVNVDKKAICNSPYFSEADRLIPITDGTISNKHRQKLIDAVYDLAASGAVDLILVESSGVVQPDIVAACIVKGRTSTAQELDKVCYLDTNVTIVDGFRILQQFLPGQGKYNQNFVESNQLIVKQIEFCDVLLFNKIDLLTLEQKNYLQEIVRQIQPTAKFYATKFSQIAVAKVIQTHLFNAQSSLNERNLSDPLRLLNQNAEPLLKIDSFVYRRRRPFHPQRFNSWLDRWPPEITRCKGVMWLQTQPPECLLSHNLGGQWTLSLQVIGSQRLKIGKSRRCLPSAKT
ncbi:metal chaperone [Liquorilactobacillus sucicola DSM 21376 = JCM 15457]|nr:GTP-binding protein [Liquorilactobacillus sucicola]GAJ26189.1 metal chaperone [Liquorilactobacillus sucicola DSM 21376 = JCM 15457]